MIYKTFIKRFFDVFFCTIALIILSPVLIIAAVGIKISSPGPVFYISYRLGKNRRKFCFFKFRTMNIAKSGDKGLCIGDEERIFRWGKIMRRLKIDELPQLINVICGDMSIVGPRPMVAGSTDDFYSGEYEIINTIRPGLTSAGSLYDYIAGDTYNDEDKYRREVVPVKLALEKMYVERQSFLYDVQLVLRTIFAIFCVFAGKEKLVTIPEYKELKESKYSTQ